MRFGYLQIYNEIDWAECQIDQAMALCDKLLITEGSQFVAFPDIPERSTDGTLDVIHDKMKEYPNRITLNYTIREHPNYRRNQCGNFNRALTHCEVGDYFISLDADEFYFNEHIERLNELMREGKADVLGSYGYDFAFGFKWKFLKSGAEINGKKHILKKTPKLFFIPTHKAKNVGPVEIINTNYVGRHHYVWLKSKDRMKIRMRTSGFYGEMVEWFNKNWDSIELKDGKRYEYYGGKFTLKRYDGNHPEILNDHTWKDVEDVRKI